ncbi:hypothetical protein Sphch_1285 [Sphingobium chlorophenolicum L-1]|uniref:Uncharacterized protein n=1 Tax=Sphingobium chlorophenolicum L-1 TaxID=690566 RepID=F6EWK2_SPHCR|nr:hypothetical protein [Sphingobium chlorophenolicum]AEG48974.1 hypothetical protein Sphch_1285 [Sphingobium chlorophenolicum L-1]
MTFAAILSANRASGDSAGSLRASLHFAGQTLVEYQARQAVRAGADRVMILVGTITPALSQAVDRLSADGIAVALVRDMLSMVRDAPRDADTLLVADGAIIGQGYFDAMAGQEGDALLVTDDSRASAPFERIDAGQRWAGMARVGPDLLFNTLDMIGDWDLALTLVRAAVQAGARRVTVPQDDLMEGRVALVETQEQADLAAQAVLSHGPRQRRVRGAAEHYLLGPAARLISPALMRMQVPAMQVRIAAMALGAIALVPIELLWIGAGFCLLLLSLLMTETADRLDEMALRPLPVGWLAFVAPAFAVGGIALAGGGSTPAYLALMLAIIQLADRWNKVGSARPWAIFTPASALVPLLAASLAGALAPMIELAMLCAIASAGTMILSRRI